MQLNGPEVYVRVVASRLGARVGIGELDDAKVRDNLDSLEGQGISHARVSELSVAGLARAVTPGAPGGPSVDTDFQMVVACTESLGGETPTEWLMEFRGTADFTDIDSMFVGGSGCANFGVGLDVARGLIASGAAGSVLLVTADKILSGTRYPEMSTTVFSDGAVSCLITAERTGLPVYRLLGMAREAWPTASPDKAPRGGLAALRPLMSAVRSTAHRATGGAVGDYHHLLTPNFGSATRHLLALAAPMPIGRLHSALVSEVGHCFAADVPLSLQDLARSGALSDGDKILALASSSNSVSAMAFQYRAG